MVKKTPLIALIATLIALSSCQFIQSVTHSQNESKTDGSAANEKKAPKKLFSAKTNTPTLIEPEYEIANYDSTNNQPDSAMVESVMFDDSLLQYSNRIFNKPEVVRQITNETPVVAMLDSLVNIRFFNTDYFITDTQQLNVYKYSKDQVPSFPDSVYKQRIAALDRLTPFDLTYNSTVKDYIDLYAVRKRNLTSRMLGLSELYFPMFEEMLDKYNLPIELKYLAIVESALHPQAGSKAGAKGLWQFMYGTGKMYGLEVNSYVDDRFDVYKSTIAACEHLTDLYNIYGDWHLVLAAYNSGAGNVNKAIRRAGGVKNYWAIWPYLPRETRGYVPAFIAVHYVMKYAAEHNLYPIHPGILFNEIDTLMINQTLAFDQISETLKIPVDEIEFLNPSFKLGIIPASVDNEYILRLPRSYASAFISNQDSVYNFKTKKGIEQEKLMAQVEKAREMDVHIVRKGENLAGIAKKHHTTVESIKSLNGLKSNMIHPGQRLSVNGSSVSSPNKTTAKQSQSSNIKRSSEESYHTVKKGENLGAIAQKYSCTATDIQNWNNLKNNTIFPGQKLIVYKPAPESETVTAVEKTSTGSVKYVYHVVKQGDTLWDIAKQYDGVTVNQIKQLNQLSNSSKLKIGQKLKVAIAG
jgi:membrane-bound lytic murein transglycosylase D